jgi:hypothetical protein
MKTRNSWPISVTTPLRHSSKRWYIALRSLQKSAKLMYDIHLEPKTAVTMSVCSMRTASSTTRSCRSRGCYSAAMTAHPSISASPPSIWAFPRIASRLHLFSRQYSSRACPRFYYSDGSAFLELHDASFRTQDSPYLSASKKRSAFSTSLHLHVPRIRGALSIPY